MILDIDFIKIKKIIKYNLKLNYYKYFNPYIINHYNIINKLVIYKSIGLSYYNKYPNSESFINLNEKLFSTNSKAKEEFEIGSLTQKIIKKSIIDDVNIIC